jgi:hypothetical protein
MRRLEPLGYDAHFHFSINNHHGLAELVRDDVFNLIRREIFISPGIGCRARRTLCSIVTAAILAAIPISAQAQSLPAGAMDAAPGKLARIADYLAGQSYRRFLPEVHDKIGAGQRKRFSIELTSGVANAIIASCGQDCDHVEVALYDYQHAFIARSNEKPDVVIVNGNPRYSGLHEVEIAVPGCRASECAVGFLVLRQDSNPDTRQPSAPRQTRGEYGGLGMQYTMQGGVFKVLTPFDDTPAAKAGVRADDIITHIDGEPVQGLPLNRLAEKLRGPAGTAVRLTIMRKVMTRRSNSTS